MWETQVQSLDWEDLEEEMATHSSILAWRIPWTEEPGGLQFTGSQRVRHDWVTKPCLFLFFLYILYFSQFSRSVVSDSLWPHGLQHTRLPCSSPTPRACSNSCPLSWWCHPTISYSVVPSPALNLSRHQGLFQRVSSSHQVAEVLELQLQHQSFNEYSGLISFRI